MVGGGGDVGFVGFVVAEHEGVGAEAVAGVVGWE